MFGDGTLASCKPISEADLAAYMADCVAAPPHLVNAVLPIGGPGPAYNALQQVRNSTGGAAWPALCLRNGSLAAHGCSHG
jgi:hypothetical protein